MSPRPFGVVQHEAAHVVVGAALGLKLHSAAVAKWRDSDGLNGGWTWFPQGARVPLAIMYAAGVAWDRAAGVPKWSHSADARLVRECVGRSRQGFEACVTAAAAILESRSLAHKVVTKALLERDLVGTDVEALARGERLPEAPGEPE